MNLNATKCTFGHSDITSRKQQKAKKNYVICDIEITLYLLSLNTGLPTN